MRFADHPTAVATAAIAAPCTRVWDVVSDIHLMSRLSGELQEVDWIGDTRTPALGARFAGLNRHAAIGEWRTVSLIGAWDPPHRFAWSVVDEQDHPSSTWSFDLVPDSNGGTTLTQTAQMGPGRSGVTMAIDRMPDKEERIVARRLSEWQAGLERNVRAVKDLAEQA